MAWLALLIGIQTVAPGAARAESQAKTAPATQPPTDTARLGQAYTDLAAGRFAQARETAGKITLKNVVNRDYVTYVLAQAAFLDGAYKDALGSFRSLAKQKGSRFAAMAAWRIADCQWELGDTESAKKAYAALLKKGSSTGDAGVARFRIAEADARAKRTKAAIKEFSDFRNQHPAHPLEAEAEARLVELGGDAAAALSARDRLARAKKLTASHDWHESIAELAKIDDDHEASFLIQRDYWTGWTLFKMRRRYEDAGRLLLSIYKKLGSDAAHALFHGARALSRADLDSEAITWYQRVVKEYPRSSWAAEAQYLSGWLEFNQGRLREGIPYLEQMKKKFPKSKYTTLAGWFLGFSHYLLGEYENALPYFEALSRRSDKLEGGKGDYWYARTLQQLGRAGDAAAGFRNLVTRYPFAWYALLAQARLRELGAPTGPFGDGGDGSVPPLDEQADQKVLADPLLASARELLEAGLDVEAGYEIERGEKAFIKRHGSARALAALMETYETAQNFNRPWMLSVVYGRRAYDQEPQGKARIWWQHGFPLAYNDLVDKHREIGKNPRYYLHSIMRKESGFDPHTLSYADAQGLLQMIPATTIRVAKVLGIPYTSDLLYDPDRNIMTGSWYIGSLLQKFKGQIPFGAGSFNSGPRPVMRWLDKWGKDHPVDEFVELVPYTQTREYMKKVTENYARYVYLYDAKVYEQPLVVDPAYLSNELTY